MKRLGKHRLRFTHIYLENWRNFAVADIGLQPRAFLVGPNAAGKSNFLDAFRFLHDLVSTGGGFEEAVSAQRGGVSKLRCLAARRYSDIVVRATVGGRNEGVEWEYELRFNQDNRQRPIIKREAVKSNNKNILERPDVNDKRDPARLSQTHLEQINVNKEFRELADFFGTVHYLHLVPQLVREPDRYIGKSHDPFGSDFLEQVARTQERTRNARLRRIREALKVAVPQLQELQFFRDQAKGTPHLRGRYEHWRPKGAWQSEEQFSDGTLRLLGLLWAILDGAGPLLLEEPELSLHPDVVRFIPQMFGRMQRRTGRQVLVSTYSDDMLQDEGIGLNEVLVLRPSQEGTTVREAGTFAEVKALLDGGSTLADAVFPRTRPPRAEQLSLFGE